MRGVSFPPCIVGRARPAASRDMASGCSLYGSFQNTLEYSLIFGCKTVSPTIFTGADIMRNTHAYQNGRSPRFACYYEMSRRLPGTALLLAKERVHLAEKAAKTRLLCRVRGYTGICRIVNLEVERNVDENQDFLSVTVVQERVSFSVLSRSSMK